MSASRRSLPNATAWIAFANISKLKGRSRTCNFIATFPARSAHAIINRQRLCGKLCERNGFQYAKDKQSRIYTAHRKQPKQVENMVMWRKFELSRLDAVGFYTGDGNRFIFFRNSGKEVTNSFTMAAALKYTAYPSVAMKLFDIGDIKMMGAVIQNWLETPYKTQSQTPTTNQPNKPNNQLTVAALKTMENCYQPNW